MTDVIEQFREAIAATGLTPPRKVVADGKMHRFAPNGTAKDDAGWYVLYNEDIPAGAFGDWRSGVQGKWRSDRTKELSPADRRAYRERIAAAKKQAEQKRIEREAEAARKAERIWSRSSVAAADHPYLVAKGITAPQTVRQYRNLLVVPVRDGKTITSLQFIAGDGRKRFLKGSRTQGCYLGIGKPVFVIVIVEGLATACSVRAATGHAVVCAFSAGNVPPVAKALRERFPDATLVYAPDNDPSRKNNHGHEIGRRGQKAAAKAVKEIGGVACLPDQPGDDWNDVHQRDGLEAVQSAFAKALSVKAPATDGPSTESPATEAPTADTVPDPVPDDRGADDYNASYGAGPSVFDAPFRVLGYNRGLFYFLSSRGGQVVEMSASQLGVKGNLFQLAPLQWWEREFPHDKGFGGQAVDMAINWLLQMGYEAGIFAADRLRGRGAWLDIDPDSKAQRAVVHLGDRLVVDGQAMSVDEIRSRNVYETARPMLDYLPDALTTREANGLYELCADLRWEVPVHGRLLAGWIAIAPICGALRWRPSIWITGASGSGKSWVMEQIIAKSLGDVLVPVQSKTSEAGIRQTLGTDARPVLFDEAEQEDLQSRTRMQSVLDLVRQSSSEGGAEIVKGTQNQSGAKRYRIRSCFAFSSINVGVEHFADESRITVLPLCSHDPDDPEEAAKAQDYFERLSRRVLEVVTPEFGARLVARSASMIPIIRDNAEVFASAVAAHFGNRRLGDQLGALLAGAYSLFSGKRLSYDDALSWIRHQNWSGTVSDDEEQDHWRLLGHLIQTPLKVTRMGTGQVVDRTIGELIDAALSIGDKHEITRDEARSVLKRHGLRTQDMAETTCSVSGAGLWVANRHSALTRIVNETPWRASWAQALARLPGAIKSTRSVRISAGVSTRAVFIPASSIIKGDQ